MTSFDPDATAPQPAVNDLGADLDAPPHRVRRRALIITTCIVGASLATGGAAWAASTSSSHTSSAAAGYGVPGYGVPGYGRPGLPSGAPSGKLGTGPLAAKHVPMLVGTVKSTGAGKILITDFEGFTRTIKVSSSTKYNNSLTATPKVGTKIEAQGKVDANGTWLDATVVETPQLPGPGGPRMGGPGGPGGRMRGGKAQLPSAPKPSATTPSSSATPASPSPSTTR